MGLMVRLLDKFALSRMGQKFYKLATDPKSESFLNNTLPTIESAIAGSLYVWSTARRKEIPDDQRALLQWQNVLTTVGGMAMGTYMNRKASEWGGKVIKHLDKELIPDAHKVIAGIKILAPLAATCVLMRFITPIIATYASGVLEERRRKSKLDIKA